jgi:FkbM family methyltransferase
MIRQTKDGWWIIPDDSHVGKWISDSGRLDHDRATLPAIEKYIPNGGVAVDAGALYGDHTIFYLDCVGQEGTVISFEQYPPAFHCLQRNCPDAVSYQLALGSKYAVYRMVHDNNYGGAYLASGEGTAVFTVPLDALELKRVDLCKLDVEGFEIEALNGASETIRRCLPTILVEVNVGALARQGVTPADLYAKIESLGYRYEFLFPSHHMNMPQTDVLCFPLDRQPPQP